LKIAVVGAGAIGGLFGGLLHNSGHEVLFVERKHKVSKLRAEGLKLMMPDSSTITVKADFRPDLVGAGHVDLCIVAVKAYDTRSAASHVASAGLECPVVLLQNGIGVEDEAEEVLGRSVARGITNCGAMAEEIGVVRVVGIAKTVLGSRDEGLLEACHELADALKSTGLPAEVTKNISGAVWTKAVVNSSINPLGALLNAKNGELLENEHARALMAMVARESWSVALALGVELDVQDPVEEVFAVARATYNNRNSMLMDLLKGKRTEVDYINGAIWKLAAERSLEAPLNKALYFMVKALEAERTRPSA
jgi:2-dehydropantoate 2-reductase